MEGWSPERILRRQRIEGQDLLLTARLVISANFGTAALMAEIFNVLPHGHTLNTMVPYLYLRRGRLVGNWELNWAGALPHAG